VKRIRDPAAGGVQDQALRPWVANSDAPAKLARSRFAFPRFRHMRCGARDCPLPYRVQCAVRAGHRWWRGPRP